MKIHVTWKKADGSKPAIELPVNPNDPHKDDQEMQLTKAIAAASAHFNQKFGEYPSQDQLAVNIIKE